MMDRYSHSNSNRYGYGTGDFREQADRSDRRYDEFYGNHSAPIRKSMNWERNRKLSHEETNHGSVRPFPGEKRRTEKRFDDDDDNRSPYSKRRHKSSTTESPRRTKDLKEKDRGSISDTEDEIPEDEVVVPDSLMDSVEKLRMREEVKRNAADEDIEKLIVFCFNGRGYSCKSCDLLMTKKTAFTAHLISKSHILNVIEARTAEMYDEIRDILDMNLAPDDWFEKNQTARSIIMKQSRAHMKIERDIKLKEEANFNRTPSNFYQFKMDVRKSIAKKEEKVIVTSLVEAAVLMDDFSGKKFFGCEFVRPVTGYHCRLCSVNIRDADDVVPHVDSRQHRDNYATYLQKNPDYERKQEEQKKELCDIMSEHPEKDIVLAESDKASDACFLTRVDSTLVRIPTLMDPELKEKKEKEKLEMEKKTSELLEKEKKEKEKKEKEKKEKEKKEKEKKEKEKKEKEKKGREKKEKEKETKDNAATEKEKKDNAAKDKEKKDNAAKVKEKKDNAAKGKEKKDNAAKGKEKKDNEVKNKEKKNNEEKDKEKKNNEAKDKEKKEKEAKDKERKDSEAKDEEKKDSEAKDEEKKEKEQKDKEKKKEMDIAENLGKVKSKEIERTLSEKKKKGVEKSGKIEEEEGVTVEEVAKEPDQDNGEEAVNSDDQAEESNNQMDDVEEGDRGGNESEEERLSEGSCETSVEISKSTPPTSPKTDPVDVSSTTDISTETASKAAVIQKESQGSSEKSACNEKTNENCVTDTENSVLTTICKSDATTKSTNNNGEVGCFEVVDEVEEDCVS